MDSSEPSISHLPENCIPHILASEIYRLSMALCYVPSPSLSRAGQQMLAVLAGQLDKCWHFLGVWTGV